MANSRVTQVAERLATCPVCSGTLEQRRVDQVSTKTIGNKYGQVQQQKITTPIWVLACTCGWMVRNALELLGARADVPEGCDFGHPYSWSLRQKIGNRLDLACMGLLRNNWPCPITESVVLEYQGFLKDRRGNDYNQTKLTVLADDSQHPEGTPLGRLVRLTGLTQGQVAGCCQRLLKGKYITRSEDRELLVPMGRGYLYRLAKRGDEFIQWALDQGLYVECQ